MEPQGSPQPSAASGGIGNQRSKSDGTNDQNKENRIRVILVLLLVLVIVISLIFLGVSGKIPVFGLGGPSFTLDAYIVMSGLVILYLLLSTLPTLMLYKYQKEAKEILIGNIKVDLMLCGIKKNDLGFMVQEFNSRNSWNAFFIPMLFNLIFLFVMWGFVFAPNGLTGVDQSLTQGGPVQEIYGDYRSYNGIKYLDYISQNQPLLGWAFLGAYFYVLTVFSERWNKSDITAGVLWKLNIRLAITVIIALLLTVTWPAVPKYIAFLVGIVPNTVLEWIGDRIKSLVKLEDSRDFLKSSPLQKQIDGINFWQSERLAEEGIESIQNLATKEIPNLLINTRFETPQLLDWIDQALLIRQVGEDKIDDFKKAYIRTASDLLDAYSRRSLEKFSKTISTDENQVDQELIKNLLKALESGPNLVYIRNYWENYKNPQKLSEALENRKQLEPAK